MVLMGLPIGGFDSTKGKAVAGNDISAVNITSTRQYRQYMNRKGKLFFVQFWSVGWASLFFDPG